MKLQEKTAGEPKDKDERVTPKLGWFCCYTPLELLYAAGFQPVRITGHSRPIGKADAFMHPNMCPYVRSCLDIALAGGYEHLAGVVFVNSCDAMRRLYDVWRKYVNHAFVFILDLPRGRSSDDVKYYAAELMKLEKALVSHFSMEITKNSLIHGIKALAQWRALYHQLMDLRKQRPSPITGKEMMALGRQFFQEAPEKWGRQVRALIEAEEKPRPTNADRPRILLSGSPIYSTEIISFIEECGLGVVFEDVCSGSRFFDIAVQRTRDMFEDLSRAYLLKPPCARMLMVQERIENMVDHAKEFHADGIIHHSLKFCDTYLYDVPVLKRRLAEAGLKVLFVEGDCTLGSFGQLKTRIEAFAEVLNT